VIYVLKYNFSDFFMKKYGRCVKNGLTLKNQLFNKKNKTF